MATSSGRLSAGVFYERVEVIDSGTKNSQSKELGEKLWTRTQRDADSSRRVLLKRVHRAVWLELATLGTSNCCSIRDDVR